jgi:hypothetical protein
MFANVNITDLIAAGIDNRRVDTADNYSNHNPVFAALSAKGRKKSFDGGIALQEAVAYDGNTNAGSYSGYDPLPTNAADVLSAALYDIKQYSTTITVSGREARIQNAGRAALKDLVTERIDAGMGGLYNLLDTDALGDGTGNAGKALTGLAAIVEATAPGSQTSTVGGINRTNFSFWRNYYATGSTATAALLQAAWNTAWSSTLRAGDKIDVVIAGAREWGKYLASLQAIQRFTSPTTAELGFETVKFMGGADVYCGAGIGTGLTTTDVLFLNTKYLKLRPHSGTDMISMPNRYATNQDAYTRIVLWAGNITSNGPRFQGRHRSSD